MLVGFDFVSDSCKGSKRPVPHGVWRLAHQRLEKKLASEETPTYPNLKPPLRGAWHGVTLAW